MQIKFKRQFLAPPSFAVLLMCTTAAPPPIITYLVPDKRLDDPIVQTIHLDKIACFSCAIQSFRYLHCQHKFLLLALYQHITHNFLSRHFSVFFIFLSFIYFIPFCWWRWWCIVQRLLLEKFSLLGERR